MPTVLVISEDPFLTDHVVTKLGSVHRVNVHAISASYQVAEAVERYRPDVIVSDNSFERARATYEDVLAPIRQKHPDIRIILLDDAERWGADPDLAQLARWNIVLKSEIGNGSFLTDAVLMTAV